MTAGTVAPLADGEPNHFARRRLFLLFLGFVGFFGFFAHGDIENTDAEISLHAADAFWRRGDFGLDGTAADATPAERWIVGEITQRGQYGQVGRNGRAYLWFPIGHQVLLAGAVAVGDWLNRLWPEPQRTYRERHGPVRGEIFWARFVTSFIPVICAAGSVVMILLLVLSLGASRRDALIVTAVATLATQFWPATSETLSDGPGMFFLLATAALVFRYRQGVGGIGTALLAGASAGWAVLTRYPHAVPVVVLTALFAVAAVQRRRRADLLWLSVAAMPQLVALILANVWRFGDAFETGYSAGANNDWWSYPWYLGVPLILFAPGKGVMWFSLPLWFALPALFSRSVVRFPILPAALIFVVPLMLFGHTIGWAAGQCWGIRYMTPSVVLLVAVGLAVRRPWRHHPWRFVAVCALGLLIAMGGVLAPYRGQQQLAFEAAAVEYPGAAQMDNHVNFDPRLSPLHTHWIYAALAATGRLERGGTDNTTLPMFGVRTAPGKIARLDQDVAFRHWWIVFGAHAFGWALWPWTFAWWLVTAILFALALRPSARD